jgi:hypothetical protein
MTELRRRMDDDMLARGFADRTREAYLWAVTGLARFYRRSPDQITDAEIQAYVVHLLRDRQLSWSTCNIVVSGVRFFAHITLKRDRTTFTIPSPRQSGKLPVVLSRDEVQRLIDSANNLRHRTMLLTTYAAGLRLTEVLHLQVHDIDSARMTIRVVLAQGNPRVIYTLLFRAAADTLLTFGHDPRHLGGTIGVTAILHTWGQTLTQHLHVHCLVTGGALSPDRTRWIRGRAAFLFPVKALSIVFRAKYLTGLQRAFEEDRLTFAAGTAPLADAARFAALVAQLRVTPWVVYAKQPFGGPAQVLKYLGRYTHRIAISNARLVSLADGIVQFRWKDYADGGRPKVMALGVEEFLRRFLLHVLPRGFVRIRHFGLLANRQRHAAIIRARHLLGAPTPDATADRKPATDLDPTLCPLCRHGHWHVVEILRPIAPAPTPAAPDTS